MGPSAVTFDLDDTLVRLDRDRSTILTEAARSVGAPDLSRDAYLVAHREHHAHETREALFAALLEAERVD
ncbi:MAG: HAD family hydrolase, partial [Halobacteriota archaeon]